MTFDVLAILVTIFFLVFIPGCICGMYLVIRELRKLFRQVRHMMTIFFPSAKSREVDLPMPGAYVSKVTVKPGWNEEKEGTT